MVSSPLPYKAIRIYMGGLTLDANTLYVDISLRHYSIHNYITCMIGKELIARRIPIEDTVVRV